MQIQFGHSNPFIVEVNLFSFNLNSVEHNRSTTTSFTDRRVLNDRLRTPFDFPYSELPDWCKCLLPLDYLTTIPKRCDTVLCKAVAIIDNHQILLTMNFVSEYFAKLKKGFVILCWHLYWKHGTAIYPKLVIDGANLLGPNRGMNLLWITKFYKLSLLVCQRWLPQANSTLSLHGNVHIHRRHCTTNGNLGHGHQSP